MGATGRPWVLTFLKTHPDSENMSIEVVHGGSPIMALGLSEIAPTIIKDMIINGPLPEQKKEEPNKDADKEEDDEEDED